MVDDRVVLSLRIFCLLVRYLTDGRNTPGRKACLKFLHE